MRLLQEESELNEVVQLVGMDGLSKKDQMKLEICKVIREDYLHQNAFHEVDTYASMHKQFKLMDIILHYYDECLEAIEKGVELNDLILMSSREDIGRYKYLEESVVDAGYIKLKDEINAYVTKLIKEACEADD